MSFVRWLELCGSMLASKGWPRDSAAEDQRHKRQLISAFLLRHGRIFYRTKPWAMRYRRWLQRQSFDHLAQQIALQEMVLAERHAVERVARLPLAN